MEWYIPVLIFVARIGDVSIGTVRTMLVFQGYRLGASILGVIEVTIWVLAVGGVVTNLTEPAAIAGYALGFGAGVYIGIWIENRLGLGYRIVRIVCTEENVHLPDRLREGGYRVTQVQGRGREAQVHIAFTVIRRRELDALRHLIAEISPKAFITVERVDRPEGAAYGDVRVQRRKSIISQQLRK